MTSIGVMNNSNLGGPADWDESDLEPAPIQRGNTWGSQGGALKLSVGCADESDEDIGSTEDLHARLQAWHANNGPMATPIPVNEDLVPVLSSSHPDHLILDNEEHFSPAAIGALLDTGQRMFQHTGDDNFVEEVWREKPPKVINGYLFGVLIGEGSYAKVKEVVEVDSLVRRAVKIFKDHRIRKIPNGAENVQREKKIMAKLDHPNCLRMIEMFRVEEKFKQYMIMDFCVASLQQVLDVCEGKHLDENGAHDVFCQMMNGLEYLHSIGIVHKDIKPGNLLISQDGLIKISDFGVAEMLSPFHANDTCTIAQGTPKFQPPEVVSGSQPTFRGFAVDVWASGITLYNILSGEYPFEGEVIMRLFDNITLQELEMPKSVKLDDAVERLLVGMLSKHPETRWKVHEIKDHEWFRKTLPKMSFNWNSVQFKSAPSNRPLSVYGALEHMYSAGGDTTIPDDTMNRTQGPVPPQAASDAVPAVQQSLRDEEDHTPPRNRRSCFLSCFRS